VGKQYQGSWKSINDVDWSVELHNSSAAATRILLIKDAEIQRDGEGDTLYENPIRSSRASITFIMRDENDYGNFELLSTNAEQVYDMRIYREGTLYWVGRVLADQMRFKREARETGYAAITVQAVDGLSLLKNYDVSPAWFTDGRQDVITLLIHILNSVELHTAWSSDPYIHECTGIANANASGENVLFHTLRDLSFADNVDIFKDSTQIKWTNCYEALEQILKGVLIGARIMHTNGVYWIYNPANYNISATPNDLDYTIWDETGSLSSTGNTYTHKKLIDPDSQRPKFEALPEKSHQAAVRLVETQFERVNGIIENRDTYSTSTLTVVHDDITTASVAPGRMCKLYYDVEFNYYITGSFKYQFFFNIYALNPSTSQKYMLKDDGYWIAASTINDITIEVNDLVGNTNSKRMQGSWTTTAPPTGATEIHMSLSIKRYTPPVATWVTDPVTGNRFVVWSTPSITNAFFRGTLAIGQAYTSSEPFPFEQKAVYVSDLDAPRNTNSNAPEIELSYYNGKKYEVGSVMVYNGATYVAAGAWSAPWTAFTGDLPELYANTWAGVYSDFRNSIRADVHDDGTYSVIDSYFFDSKYWIFNGGTHDLTQDTFSGEWLAILASYTNVNNNGEGEKIQNTEDYIFDRLNRLGDEIGSIRQFIGQLSPQLQTDIINFGEGAPTADPATDREYLVGLKYNYNGGDSFFEWQVLEGVRTVSITATYTATETHGRWLFMVDTSGGNVTINFPAASTIKSEITIMKYTADGSTVTINPNGSETIDFNATATLGTRGQKLTIISDGTNLIST